MRLSRWGRDIVAFFLCAGIAGSTLLQPVLAAPAKGAVQANPVPGTAAATPSNKSANDGCGDSILQICIPQKCRTEGNCELNDLVTTAVSFARLLMGLSGALFFFMFVYGGTKYLTSFGSGADIKKGEDAIKGAAIGIVIVMASWTIVRYVTNTIAPDVLSGKFK